MGTVHNVQGSRTIVGDQKSLLMASDPRIRKSLLWIQIWEAK
jgi:hypothetical protein